MAKYKIKRSQISKIIESVILEQYAAPRTDYGRAMVDWLAYGNDRNIAMQVAAELESKRFKNDPRSPEWLKIVKSALAKLDLDDPKALKYFMSKYSK